VAVRVEVVLELLVAHLVAVLKGAIVLCVFLHCVVSQVYELVVRVVGVDIELGAARPQVALFEEEDAAFVVDEDPHADIKLPLIHQERHLDIFLDDEAVVLELELVVVRVGCTRLLLLGDRGLILRGLQHL
jgi:hypothetical protein